MFIKEFVKKPGGVGQGGRSWVDAVVSTERRREKSATCQKGNRTGSLGVTIGDRKVTEKHGNS